MNIDKAAYIKYLLVCTCMYLLARKYSVCSALWSHMLFKHINPDLLLPAAWQILLLYSQVLALPSLTTYKKLQKSLKPAGS